MPEAHRHARQRCCSSHHCIQARHDAIHVSFADSKDSTLWVIVLKPLHSNANNPSSACTYSEGGYKNPARQFYAKCDDSQETLDYHGKKDRPRSRPNMVDI